MHRTFQHSDDHVVDPPGATVHAPNGRQFPGLVVRHVALGLFAVDHVGQVVQHVAHPGRVVCVGAGFRIIKRAPALDHDGLALVHGGRELHDAPQPEERNSLFRLGSFGTGQERFVV